MLSLLAVELSNYALKTSTFQKVTNLYCDQMIVRFTCQRLEADKG